MSRSRYKKRPNRRVKILTTIFTIFLVLSFVLSLVGPFVFRGPSDPTPIPTFAFATLAPASTPTPSASATPTPGVPTPIMITPTAP